MQTRFTRRTRLLSWLLTLAMLLSIAPVSAFAATGDVAIDETNFPDENFRAIVASFDKNSDNVLSADEIAAVTKIDCELKEISDLKGIEHFTALTDLNVKNNQLTTLDVSKNTALTILNVRSNQLTTLDLSKNIELKELWGEWNQLATLDVSQNLKLEKLLCGGNLLTALDVRKNTALVNLYAENTYGGNNQLTELDVSKNPALRYLNVQGNQLTKVDVSQNPNLNGLNVNKNPLKKLDVSENVKLQSLNCWNCQLTELNVSSNANLNMLHCGDNRLASLNLSQNPKLKTLTCYNNQLTSLDVSKNSALEMLQCYNNPLTSLDLTQNTSLKNKALSTNTDESGYPILLNADNTFALSTLPGNFEVSRARNWQGGTVSGNTLTVDEGASVVDYTYQCNDTTTASFKLKVSGYAPAPAGIAIDATNFPDGNFSGCIVQFDENNDHYLSADEIAKATKIECKYKDISNLKGIEFFTALTELNVSGNQLTALDVSHNTALTNLNVGHNQLTTLDVSQNTALTELNVNSNALTTLNVDSNAALEALYCNNNQLATLDVSSNANLEELYCLGNKLTELDVSRNSNLETLYCYDNQLTSLDVSGNSSLQTLYCYNNKLTNLDVSGNTALTELYCNINQLKKLDVSSNAALKELICSTNQLTALDLNGNAALEKLSCDGNYLSTLDVSGNSNLQTLDCSSNQLTKLDLGSNLKSLGCENNRLTELDTSNNAALFIITCGGNKLTSLDLSQNPKMAASYSTFENAGNRYPIQLKADNTFDLSTLPGNFEVNNASNWQGGTVSGNTLTVDEGASAVTYTYQCSDTLSSDFTLEVSGYAPAPAGVAINDTNFPDDNFRNYIQETFDEDGNKFLSQSEIDSVTVIGCYSRNISDLTGIEFFTALKFLDASCNDLATLDMSKNLALKTLWCYENQLTSLDVSKNTALETLYCHENPLAELDVSKNTALEMLFCYDNQLTTLDVSKNTVLETLYCYENQLAELDVSQNRALILLYCYGNNLTELDVSQNQDLIDLECDNNRLTELDVKKNSALKNLSCNENQLTELNVSQNSALQMLFCDRNQLTQLDVSQNKNLGVIQCSNNQLTSLDLSQNPNIIENYYSNAGNRYPILLNADNTFDLSTLPGNFDVNRASDWQGGTVSGNILTVDEGFTAVTYTYKCSDALSSDFTLDVSGTAPGPDTPDPDKPDPDTPARLHTLTFEDCTVEVKSAATGASTAYTASPIQVAKGDTVTLTLDESKIPEGMKFNGFVLDPIPAPDEMTSDGTTLTFTMPDEDTTVRVNFCTESEDSSLDFGTVVTGAAVAGVAGFVAYQVGTEVILDQLLPKGVAVPGTRADLALLLWNAAGSPAPAAVPAFVDVEDPALANAAQWALEQGYLKAREDGSFAPEKRVAKWRVIKALRAASDTTTAQ